MRNFRKDLALPPRQTSLAVKLTMLFGGFNNQFGWIFTTVGFLGVGIFSQVVMEEPVGRLERLLISGIPLIFLFIGVYFLRQGLNKGLHALYLLKNGELTFGKITKKEATNTRINNRTVFAYTIEYEADSMTHQILERTHLAEKLEDDAEEPIVYDPRDTQYALALDNLPASLDVNRQGSFHFAGKMGILKTLFSIIIPLACISMILVYLAWETGFLFPVDDGVEQYFNSR
ncbi:MAG: hypothetical protein ACRBF0_11190 [Calditrichia bacterium]